MKNVKEQDLFSSSKKEIQEKKPDGSQLHLDFTEPTERILPSSEKTGLEQMEKSKKTVLLSKDMKKKSPEIYPAAMEIHKTLRELKEEAKSMKEEAKPPVKSDAAEKKTVLVHNDSSENPQTQPKKSPEPKKSPVPFETQSYHQNQEQKSIPKPTTEGKSLPHKEQHKNPLKISDGTSIGHLLQEARVRANFSIDQVATQTKIKKSYIEAIERDDFNALPSSVYVNAYIKRLFEQYGIDDSLSKSAIQKLKGKDIHYTVSEEILLGIEKGKQVNLEKETKLKSFKMAASFGIAIIAGLCILGGVLLLGKSKRSEKPSTQEGRKTTLNSLQGETVSQTEIDAKLRGIVVSYPTGNMSELKAP